MSNTKTIPIPTCPSQPPREKAQLFQRMIQYITSFDKKLKKIFYSKEPSCNEDKEGIGNPPNFLWNIIPSKLQQ